MIWVILVRVLRSLLPGAVDEWDIVKTLDELYRRYYMPTTLSILSQQTVTVSKGWIIKIQAQGRDGLSIFSQRTATLSK